MRTHCLIFPIIGNLVSLPNSLSSARVGDGPTRPPERRIGPFAAARGSRAVKPWDCGVAQTTRDGGCLLVCRGFNSLCYDRLGGFSAFPRLVRR